ncbi:hypothetical protein ILYODFUR_017849 [Ilyodon furcidens]|uniref:Uncharacterized protein n=1 Tax=Ilyodon furcidens TaxID=33524 RepID=A0ABV0UA45_9TELE
MAEYTREHCLATATLDHSLRRRSLASYKWLLAGDFLLKRHWKCLKKLDECDSRDERDSDNSWSVFSSSDSESESEPPPAKKRWVVPSEGGCDALFQATVPKSAQLQRQEDEPASSSQDKRTPEKEEKIGKDSAVWTMVVTYIADI